MKSFNSKELRNHFSRGALASLTTKVIGMGVTFLVMVIFARALGVDEFGVYAYVWGWLSLILVFSRFGFDTTVLRFVASYSTAGDWPLAKGVLKYALRISLVSALIGSLAITTVVLISGEAGPASQRAGFLIAALILPISVRSSLYQSAIRALKHPGLADIPELIIRPVSAGAVIFTLFLISEDSLDATNALIGQLLGVIFSVGIAVLIWRYCSKEGSDVKPVMDKRDEWLKVSLPLLLISAFQFVLHQMDVVMLGYIRGASEVGGYVPASRIADLVGFGLVVVSSMAAPMISSLYSRGKKTELQSVVNLATQMASVFALFIFVIIVIFRLQLLEIFGEGFSAGELPLIILAVGQLINVLIGPVGYLTTMTGHHVAAGRIVAVSALLNLILNIFLIPIWGVIGASIATASAMAFSHCLLGFYVWKKLKLNSTAIPFLGLGKSKPS